MPTLADPAARAAIIARFDRLTPTANPRWGKMTAPQMVAHLCDAMRMARGDLAVKPKNMPLLRWYPIKMLVIYVLPFPKNAPTAREIISRTPDDFNAEVSAAKALIERNAADIASLPEVDHPVFGKMSRADWGALGHRHIDHHLRQFGV